MKQALAVTVLLCSSLVVSSPVAAYASSNAAVTTDALAEKLKDLPGNAKRIVEDSIDFFGMTNPEVFTQRIHSEEWRVQLKATNTDVQQNRGKATSISMIFSGKTGKLQQLDVSRGKKDDRQSPDEGEAIDITNDFVNQILGKNTTVGNNTEIIFDHYVKVPIYPVINDIPVQKPIGTVTVHESGSIHSYQRKEANLDEKDLPSATNLIPAEKAKKTMVEQSELELVYDDERNQYQYALRSADWLDAKTGELFNPVSKYVRETRKMTGTEEAGVQAKVVQGWGHTFFGMNQETVSISTSRESHPDEKPIAVYRLTDETGEVEIKVDEETGTLLTVSTEKSSKSNANPFTHAEAKKLALRFIEQYVPMETGDYLLEENLPDGGDKQNQSSRYHLAVYPLYDGVRTAQPVVAIAIDLHGNALLAAKARPYQKSSAAAPAVITAEKAKQLLSDSLQLELNYVYPRFWDQSEKPRLVYLPAVSMKGLYVDAVSGKLASNPN